MATRKKLTVYLDDATRDAIQGEAARHDRSISWVIEAAWRIAGPRIQALPSIDDAIEDVAPRRARLTVVADD